MPSLIDEYLPLYDVVERHSIRVRAPADRVYAAIRAADLAGNPMVRGLLALRALPGALLAGRAGFGRWSGEGRARIRLSNFEQHGFTVLAEDPPRELLIGLAGRFWTLRGNLRTVNVAMWAGAQEPGTARAAWNFRVLGDGPSGSGQV